MSTRRRAQRSGTVQRRIVVGAVVVPLALGVRAVVPNDATAVRAMLSVVATVSGGVVVALALLWIAHTSRMHDRVRASNDVMGFIYATIGVIYSVVFAFVVVSTWQQFEDARKLEDAESQAVADLLRLLPGLALSQQAAAETALHAYMDAAIDVEWPRMAAGDDAGTDTVEALDRLWTIYAGAEPAPAEEGALFDTAVNRLVALGEIRRQRVLAHQHGIPGLLWTALIFGALVTVGFAAGFGVESWSVHAWLVGALGALVALFLLVTVELDRPYSGDIRVRPEQFVVVRKQFAPGGTPHT